MQTVGALGALLHLTSACDDELSVGKEPAVCSAASSSACSSTIALSKDYVGISAHATSTLMPTWKTSLPVGFTSLVAPAKDGGLWLVGSAADGLIVQHLSAAGQLGARNVLSAPAGSIGAAAPLVSIEAVTPDPRGALLFVVWYQAGAGSCPAGSAAAVDGSVCFSKSELIVLNEDDVAGSLRVEPADSSCQGSQAGYRSVDGSSVTLLGRTAVCRMKLTGELSWLQRLPDELSLVASAQLDADSVVFAGFTQQKVARTGAPANTLGLSLVQPDGSYDERLFDLARTLYWPRTVMLPGTALGKYSVVLERLTPYGGTGDLSIARFNGRELESEQVLIREDYLDLSIVSATTDAAATIYVATGTGVRDLTDVTDDRSISYTPVLCQIPLEASAACFETPLVWAGQPWTGVDGRRLQATSPHVVYSVFGGSITDPGNSYEVSRYDLP